MLNEWKCIACGQSNFIENLRCAHCGVASKELSESDRNEKYQEQVESVPLSSYCCIKCKSSDFEVGELLMSGGRLSAIFNLQNRKFINLSCNNCGYTELYKGNVSNRQKILDLLIG